MFRNLFIYCLLVFLISACQNLKQPDTEGFLLTVSVKNEYDLYNQAVAAIEQGKYLQASALLTKINQLYPFSELVPNAQILEIYVQYRLKDYTESELLARYFLNFNPYHPRADYVTYLQSLCLYTQINEVEFSQDKAILAKNLTNKFLNKYSDSAYSAAARKNLHILNTHLAGQHMLVGNYQRQTANFTGAIQNFQIIVQEYENTVYTPEALYRLAELFYHIGIIEQAQEYAAILGRNYPQSSWYNYAYSLMKKHFDRPLN